MKERASRLFATGGQVRAISAIATWIHSAQGERLFPSACRSGCFSMQSVIESKFNRSVIPCEHIERL
ncbi:MAG: hypothetical protein AAB511_00220 [Patescibacteria group bacterium]